MRLGVSVRIDVTKIDKSRLFKGEKGTYLDLTTFIDTDEKDRFDNNGFISQSTSKEERETGVQTPILGNVRVFTQSGSSGKSQSSQADSIPDNFDDYPF